MYRVIPWIYVSIVRLFFTFCMDEVFPLTTDCLFEYYRVEEESGFGTILCLTALDL